MSQTELSFCWGWHSLPAVLPFPQDLNLAVKPDWRPGGQADHLVELPNDGEFSLGGERGDVDLNLYSDQIFQGQIVKADGQVEVLFDEYTDSNDGEWYFAETFQDLGYAIEKIDE